MRAATGAASLLAALLIAPLASAHPGSIQEVDEDEAGEQQEQEEEDTTTLREHLELIGSLQGGEGVKEEIEKLIDAALLQDDTLNGVLDQLNPATGLGKLLKDANIRFKTFEGRDGNAQLGFEYDLTKSLLSPTDREEDEQRFIYGATFYARGNVAFDQAANPNDFLETGVSVNAFRHSFKPRLENPVTAELQDSTQAFFTLIAKEDLEPDDYRERPEWRSIEENIRGLLGRDVLIDVSGHATFESNQDFSSSQFAYGLRAGIVAREWSPDAFLSRFNLFDYPFGLVRVLTGAEDSFTPTGTALPTLMVGLDAVEPKENEARVAVGDDGVYPRFRSEIAMKSRLGHLSGQVISASLGWRYYREIDASSAIKTANLDEHSFFAARIDFPAGVYASYSTGKLPLDASNDSVLALGFQVHL